MIIYFPFHYIDVESIQWYQNLCSWLSICLILIFPICQKRIKNGAWTVLIFFNFALVVYMKILQYCFQSYFNLHRHHWGRVDQFLMIIYFPCLHIFLDHESPESISGADKPVTSSSCKLTSLSSCRPPKPALDDNEIY